MSTTTSTFALSPRWGQKAAYVASSQSVYFVGGAVSSNSSKISSDVVVLDLTQDDPDFTDGPTSSLGPVAFHTLSITTPSTTSTTSEQLLVIGGMTSSCAENPVIYSLDVGKGDTEWEGENVAVVRRRAAGSAWMEKEGVEDGEVVVVGGMADAYVCSSGTYAYPAYDVLTMPMSADSYDSTVGIPASASTDSAELAVADFALAKLPNGNNTLIMAGGHDIAGDLMSFDKIGMYTQAEGWMVMPAGGDLPTPRVGHSMVPHPTLDLMILFGGSDSEDGQVTPKSGVWLLNTTSWTWSAPWEVQPAESLLPARAWHSAVMIPSGVMVAAFGMGADATVLGDKAFLDARSDDPLDWSWTDTWNSSWVPAKPSNAAHKAKEIKSIVPSVLVFMLIIVPLGIWFARRHVKQERRRQLARHFEMHDEDENSGRTSGGAAWKTGTSSDQHGSTFGNFANPLSQFVASISPRRSSSFSSSHFGQFKPFGGVRMQDDSEKQSGLVGTLRNTFDDLKARAQAVRKSGSRNPFADPGKEMRQVGGRGAGTGDASDKPQWEEIDFGLGKVDEGRRGSAAPARHVKFSQETSRPTTPSAGTPSTPKMIPASAMRSKSTSVPSLVIVPPSVDGHNPNHAVVPSPTRNSLSSAPIIVESPVREITNYPVMKPVSPNIDQAGWDQLADTLASKPVFRSEDPFSNSADISQSSAEFRRASLSSAGLPVLPPMDFQARRAPSMGAGGQKWNDSHAFRRLSESGPMAPRVGFMGSKNSSRTVSQPVAAPLSQGRDLTSMGTSFNDRLNNVVRSVSGSPAPYTSSLTPAPASIASTRDLTANPTNRLSNPPLFPPPSSPLPAPAAANDFSPAPGLNHASSTGTARDLTMAMRGSGDAALRVVNVTPDPSGSIGMGRAL